MRLEELGKEGFKLWVIWSNTKLARNIRTFVIYAVYATGVGYGVTYLWALWWPSILIAPFVVWFLMCTFPLWMLRREGRKENEACEKERQATIKLLAFRRERWLEAQKRKEERKLSGRKPNR